MKTIKSIMQVALSNMLTIISGILISFAIPKILSVHDYGLYKIFTLYTSYLGLFSMGIIDGIVLKYGAMNYENLDPKRFRAYFKWYAIINLFWSILFVLIAILIISKNIEYTWIIVLLSINLLAVNVTGYFQQISQITQRFKEYSARKTIQSCLNVIIVFLFWIYVRTGGASDYKIFIVMTLIVNVVLSCWYLKTYKAISFGKSDSLLSIKSDIVVLGKDGFPLLFANLCSTLIMSLDRQFVSVLFETSDYAIYAFAYSMLSLITVATSAVSTVLYPFLKRLSIEEFKDKYEVFLLAITISVFVLCVAFFPLTPIIHSFLPKYYSSLSIFRIIIPGLAISSAVTVIMHNYYKTLGYSNDYFKKSIIILAISASANIIAYYLFATMQAISIASVITILIWYLYVGNRLSKVCKVNTLKNVGYIICMLCCFYSVSYFNDGLLGGLIYLLLFGTLTLVFYKSHLHKLYQIIIKK